MVAGGEPRGLPRTTIKTVALQQRMSEHPLDDVIVHAVDGNGSPSTLEIRAKRSMSFTASDTEFADVVSQMWAASQKPEFSSTRYELAVAISRTTTRVEEAIQDVLHWARVHHNAASFHADVQRKGFASQPMRDFVAVFGDNLKACGGSDDDETVWRLLRRFQVLVFDFEAEGSTYEHYARDRCRMVLAPGQANRAGDLWAKLIVEAGAVAQAAGTLSRQRLVESLAAESGYHFAAERSHQVAFDRLAEEAHLALKDVDDQIGGARLSRSELVATGRKALDASRILNVTGAPGSGKTMVLKRFVELSENEGRDEDDRDADGRPFTFNASFFDYLGILLAALPSDDAARMIESLMGLPGEAFVDAAATLVRGFDRAVNSTDATKPSDVFALRLVTAFLPTPQRRRPSGMGERSRG